MKPDSTAQTLKLAIRNYLEEKRDWIFGGPLEEFMRINSGCKGETTGRLCRFLKDDGLIESRVVSLEIDGKKKRAVQYRYIQDLTRFSEPSYPQPTTPIKSGDEVVNVPSLF